MSIQEILAELPRLSVDERGQVAKTLRELEEPETMISSSAHEPRVAGLHAGAWIIADDFDDPLPDEFWLGEEA